MHGSANFEIDLYKYKKTKPRINETNLRQYEDDEADQLTIFNRLKAQARVQLK